MQSSRFALLVFLLLALLFIGCSGHAGNTNTEHSAASNSFNNAKAGPKDNIEELGMLVRLPFPPEEVAWEENREKKTLTAVIRFSPENAQKMSAEISKNGQPSPATVTVESWYPNELIAQGEMTAESTVKGQSYPAETLLNPPYTNGKITRIENTDYFILQISS